MEKSHDPHAWTLREWLAFLLLAAAGADGHREHAETRYLRVELGNEAVDQMQELLDQITPEERDTILQESLPIFLKTPGAREKLQTLLRNIFLADGNYGPEEQALTHKISHWIRTATID
jgi:uncharacterized tellurite resistance protein B-like protein